MNFVNFRFVNFSLDVCKAGYTVARIRADYSICLIAMNTTSTFRDLFRYMGKSSVCYRENYGYAYQLLPTEPQYTPFLNFVKAQELS